MPADRAKPTRRSPRNNAEKKQACAHPRRNESKGSAESAKPVGTPLETDPKTDSVSQPKPTDEKPSSYLCFHCGLNEGLRTRNMLLDHIENECRSKKRIIYTCNFKEPCRKCGPFVPSCKCKPICGHQTNSISECEEHHKIHIHRFLPEEKKKASRRYFYCDVYVPSADSENVSLCCFKSPHCARVNRHKHTDHKGYWVPAPTGQAAKKNCGIVDEDNEDNAPPKPPKRRRVRKSKSQCEITTPEDSDDQSSLPLVIRQLPVLPEIDQEELPTLPTSFSSSSLRATALHYTPFSNINMTDFDLSLNSVPRANVDYAPSFSSYSDAFGQISGQPLSGNWNSYDPSFCFEPSALAPNFEVNYETSSVFDQDLELHGGPYENTPSSYQQSVSHFPESGFSLSSFSQPPVFDGSYEPTSWSNFESYPAQPSSSSRQFATPEPIRPFTEPMSWNSWSSGFPFPAFDQNSLTREDSPTDSIASQPMTPVSTAECDALLSLFATQADFGIPTQTQFSYSDLHGCDQSTHLAQIPSLPSDFDHRFADFSLHNTF